MGQSMRRVQQVAEACGTPERGRLGHGPEPPEQVVQRRENIDGAAEPVDGRRLYHARTAAVARRGRCARSQERLHPSTSRRHGRISLKSRRRRVVEPAAPLPEVVGHIKSRVVRPAVPARM